MKNPTFETLVFSNAAVRRVMGLEVNHPIETRTWKYVIWVHAAGFKPTLISKKVLLTHFADYRKEASKTLVVTQIDNSKFWVASSDGINKYKIYISGTMTACNCKDYEMQNWALPSKSPRVCKHIYAGLSYLGFNSFSEYLAA